MKYKPYSTPHNRLKNDISNINLEMNPFLEGENPFYQTRQTTIMTSRHPLNVPGPYFVDTSCINCDTCREIAPRVFREDGGQSIVSAQPEGEDIFRSNLAIVACPTGSIHTDKIERRKIGMEFPLHIKENVYYNGFNSPKSYGAKSYLIVHPDGNWMVDSPRFSKTLVSKIEDLGGLTHIFLTHRDDVADADKFSRHFGAERLIHEGDRNAQPDAEITFEEEFEIGDFRIIPTPGHTRGSSCLLYKKYLFTGDHLYRRGKWFRATRSYNWWSWEEQVKSLRKLADYDFQWILPGHGHRLHLNDMKERYQEFLEEVSDPNYW